jgi:DNA (cytosine-5)-methyltransferase 1
MGSLTTSALFCGVGGIELGLERAGHKTALFCDIDEGAREVISAHFNAPVHADVKTLKALAPCTDLVTAGFPCQDLSQAGRTAGITGSKSSLVNEVFRLLSPRAPRALIENVSFMLQLNKGKGMDYVVSNLEDLGFRWAYRCVNTMSFGIPQRRKRVYLLASKVDDPCEVLFADNEEPHVEPHLSPEHSLGFYWTEGTRGLGKAVNAIPTLKGGSGLGIPSTPAIMLPRIVGKTEIIMPSLEDCERLQGFPAGWTQPAENVVKPRFRFQLIGNSVSVPVAEWIGNRLTNPGTIVCKKGSSIKSGDKWPSAAYGDTHGRWEVDASEAPVKLDYPAIHDFLTDFSHPLSVRATTGFMKRLEKSSLKARHYLVPHLRTYLHF